MIKFDILRNSLHKIELNSFYEITFLKLCKNSKLYGSFHKPLLLAISISCFPSSLLFPSLSPHHLTLSIPPPFLSSPTLSLQTSSRTLSLYISPCHFLLCLRSFTRLRFLSSDFCYRIWKF